ncbi:Helix-turn-helix domain-containing protein [Hyphomicrobiales bacterium]|nr:Helix-turn-helix domain-containing protein [Hyphomicrobiales bacterium]CAH1698615.1 Helix-turn-helix domain-containing protein [Hyphomicrobiales bacterium]CAI0342262.1 AraC family transcriptional regulator, transcriptional activator of pobA [Hyphomicrobiales bacterium]
MPGRSVPAYWLYGERLTDRFPDALHIEPIVARSSLHGWTIQPHLHHDLFQFFLVTEGGGRTRVDGREHPLAPGSVLLLPPSTIHEFAFLDDTDGFVASAAATSLKRLFGSEPEARALLGAAAVLHVPVGSPSFAALDGMMRLAMGEFAANLPAREFSLGAYADLIASWFMREMRGVRAGAEPLRDARAELVRRFVERVEARFQHHEALADYARSLGASVPHLSRSCRELLGHSAARVIQDRLMIEARRDLVYTAMSIAQISFRLGFSDPAYFSRFFAKRAGISPSDYRARA